MIASNECYYSSPRQTAVVSRTGEPARISAMLLLATASLTAGTSSAQAAPISALRVQQTSPLQQYVLREEDVGIDRALHELKDGAGMTWGQVAMLFGVSRKTVHNWISGQGAKADHRAAIFEALDMLREMAGERTFKIRRALLGDKLPIRKFASGEGPSLDSVSEPPRHRPGASEDNTLEILE